MGASTVADTVALGYPPSDVIVAQKISFGRERKMVRCERFYLRVKEFLDHEDLEGLEDYCKKQARQTLFRIRKYVEFCEEYMLPIGNPNLSECALRPLLEDPRRDPDTTHKVVEELRPMLLKPQGKKPPRITSETVRKIMSNVRGEPYLTSAERRQLGGEENLKKTESACNGFLNMVPSERTCLLNDLRGIIDTLGHWGAQADEPALRDKIDHARKELDGLRNELLMFLPGSEDHGRDGHSCDRNIHR